MQRGDESIWGMEKVSFSDGLAIVGLVLTVILVVLDKGGKLKGGPMLLVLLALAACLTLPLAFSIPWVTDSVPGFQMFTRMTFMFFFVGVIYSGIGVWISGDAKPEAKAVKARIRFTDLTPRVVLNEPIALDENYMYEGDKSIKIKSQYAFLWVEEMPDHSDVEAVTKLEENVWKTLQKEPIAIPGVGSTNLGIFLTVPPKMTMHIRSTTTLIATPEIIARLDGNSAMYMCGKMTDETEEIIGQFCVRIDRDRNHALTLCLEHN